MKTVHDHYQIAIAVVVGILVGLLIPATILENSWRCLLRLMQMAILS